MNFLVVDDEASLRTLLRRVLTGEGHNVVDAADGVEALEVLRREPVDVIITDIMMPRMDGYRLCQEVRRDERLKGIPFIFHTASFTAPEDEKLALDLGADVFLRKPAEVEAILRAIRQMASRPRAKPAVTMPEAEVMREYSDRLVAKLEQRNAELAAAEAKFRTLVEQSLTGIYIIQDERFVYVNPKMAEIFGRPVEEMTSRPVYDFIVPEDQAMARENIRKRISGEAPSIRYNLHMLHQSGAVLQVEVHGSRAEYEGRPAVMGTLLDVTERKRAEEALNSSELRFRSVWEHSLDGMRLLDAGGNIVAVNEAYCRLVGMRREELVGQPFTTTYVGSKPAAEMMQKFRDRFARRAVPDREVRRMTFRNHRETDLEITSSFLEMPDGTTLLLGLFRDVTERRQAEEALRASEERYRALVDQAPTGIFVNLDNQFAYVNAAFCRIVGASSPEQLLGRPVFERYQPDFHDAIRKRIAHVLDTGESVPLMDMQYVRLDGSPVAVETMATRITFQGRRATQVMVNDVTQRKQAIEALDKERALLRTMADNLPAYIFVKDATGHYLLSNASHTRLLGAGSETEVLGKTAFDFLPPPVAEAYARADAELLRTGTAVIQREEASEVEGKPRWYSLTKVPLRDQQGNITGLIGIKHDITERKLAEQALHESELLYHSLVENLPQNIFRKDRAGRFTFVNQKFCDTLGRTRKEVLGRTDADLFPPEFAAKYQQDDLWVMETRQLYSVIEEHVSPGDKHLFVEVIKAPVTDSTGAVTGTQGIFWDVTERETAAQTLRESEAAFSMIFRASPALISIATVADGRLIQVNERYCEFFGYEREEMVGKTVTELNLWANPEDRAAAIQRLRQEGVVHGLEARCRLKSGEVRYALGSLELIDLAGESEPVLISMFTDITERKRAEEALRESEERLSKAFQASPTTIAISSWPEGRYVDVNEHFIRTLGFTREEVIGHRAQNFGIWPKPEQRDAIIAALERGESVRDFECLLRTKSGALRDMLVSVERLNLGKQPCLLFINHDITERKLAEEKLAEERNLLRTLIDNLPAYVFVKDTAGSYLLVNEAHTKQLGLGAETELLGKTSFDFFPEEIARRFDADDQAVIQTGQPVMGREEPYEVGGKRGWFLTTKVPLRDVQGNITGLIGITHDITAKKQLEEQFLRSQRMEAIGALAGGIAHDLNNALAPVLMASEFLKLTCTDADTRRVLDTIHESARRGSGMVKQILTFARGTEGERGVVQPKHLVKEMIGIAQHTFPKTIQIRTDVATDTWPLLGNPTQLHQILLNLCVNARDAMPKGGALTLAAGNTRLKAMDTVISPDAKPGPYVLLSVTDTGTGMPPAVRARIFDAFFTTKEPGKGTGLGLSTVQGIVKEHGGFLTVDSAVGKGTTFEVYLPAQETAAPAAEVEQPKLPMGNGELILVVDDEAAIRSIATQTLQAFGYQVVTANDGAQAISMCAQHLARLQLLITDMAMPIMDGQAAIRAMRVIAPRLKVIAASGSDTLASSPALKELDVQAFLRKPFSADDLIRTVHEVLQEKIPS